MKFVKLIICLLTLYYVSCTTVSLNQNIEDYSNEIQKLLSQLTADPNNFEALRDLGVIYFQTQHYGRAQKLLLRAYSINADDAKKYQRSYRKGFTEEYPQFHCSADGSEFSVSPPWRTVIPVHARQGCLL